MKTEALIFLCKIVNRIPRIISDMILLLIISLISLQLLNEPIFR